MPGYDASQFDPPAPVASVALRNQLDGAAVPDVLMLVDSGADVTLIPRTAIEKLGSGLTGEPSYELVGFDGTKHFAPATILDLIFLRRAFRGRYLVIESECGILGRDVLNHIAILMDRPRRAWSEVSP